MNTQTNQSTELRKLAPWATEVEQDDEEGWVELRRTWGGTGPRAPLTLLVVAHQRDGRWEPAEGPTVLVQCERLGGGALSPQQARELAGWLQQAADLASATAGARERS